MKVIRVPIPDGKCFCGCGEEVPEGSFFSRGHDKAAESMLTKLEYGPANPVACRLAAKGYGGQRKNLKAEYDKLAQQALDVWAKAKAGR